MLEEQAVPKWPISTAPLHVLMRSTVHHCDSRSWHVIRLIQLWWSSWLGTQPAQTQLVVSTAPTDSGCISSGQACDVLHQTLTWSGLRWHLPAAMSVRTSDTKPPVTGASCASLKPDEVPFKQTNQSRSVSLHASCWKA